MAVASQLTSLETFESSPTYANIGSGGGAGDNTDVFIEGAQSGGRRIDNTSDKGFMATITAVDLSAAGEHVKIWCFCFHWSNVTGFTARLQSGTNVYDNHEYGAANVPVIGGWVPLWVDVSRTPDSQGSSGSANEASINNIGAYIDIGNVGGAGDNWIIDEIHHGTSGYLWTGTAGDFDDFRTFETNNVEGVLLSLYGADLCFARLEIGDGTNATTFTDSGFSITWPDQPLVSTTFQGLSIDITRAGDDVNLSNGVLASGDPAAATNRPDLIVTTDSAPGTLDMDVMVLNGLRTVELGEGCTMTNSVVLNTGVIDATAAGDVGADMTGTSILDSTVAANTSALIWAINEDPDGKLDDMTFNVGGNAHHAIEFGTTSPLTMTVRGMAATGYNASNGQNDSTFHVKRTSGTVTINVIGGTGNFSYRTDGATVVVVIDPVDTLVTILDGRDNSDLQNARVILEAANGTGDLPFEDSVTITRSGSTASVAHTAHGLVNGNKVVIRGADQAEYNGVKTITNVTTNAYDYTVTGSPTTPATGTIIATGVVLEGLTDVSGEIKDTRTWTLAQPVIGVARKATASPIFADASLTGVVNTSTGLLITQALSFDE